MALPTLLPELKGDTRNGINHTNRSIAQSAKEQYTAPPHPLVHAMKAVLGTCILLLCLASTASALFALVAHRGFNCLVGTVKFTCLDVGYNFCCKRRNPRDHQLYIGFLSMTQTSAQLGDIQVVYKAAFGNACGGTSVGSDSYGCADASRGIAFGGKALRCLGDCVKSSVKVSSAETECLGEVYADAIFYDDKAYEADPEDDRMKELVEKIDLDEQLSPAELQELEVIRLPELDYIATLATNRNAADSQAVSSGAQNESSENATSQSLWISGYPTAL